MRCARERLTRPRARPISGLAMGVESHGPRGRAEHGERRVARLFSGSFSRSRSRVVGALLTTTMGVTVACGGRSNLAEWLGEDDGLTAARGGTSSGGASSATAGTLSMGRAGTGGPTTGGSGMIVAGAPSVGGAAGAPAIGGLGGLAATGGLGGSGGRGGVGGGNAGMGGVAGAPGSVASLPTCGDELVFESVRGTELAGRPPWARGGWAAVTGHWNDDGRLDLALLSESAPSVSVLLGEGDGTFRPRVDYPVSDLPSYLVVGDFDGDGNDDLATAAAWGRTITLLLGRGDGTFAPGTKVETADGISELVAGDWNGDQASDLVIGQAEAGTIAVLVSNKDGTFTRTFEHPGARAIAAGHVDANNRLDLVVANEQVEVLLGNGDGTFTPGAQYEVPGSNVVSVGLYDFYKNDALDIAVSPQCPKGSPLNGSLLLGNGDGSFAAPYETNGWICVLGPVGDLDDDQVLDVFSGRVMLGKGDGTFTPGPETPYSPTLLADWNGDQTLDLLAMGPGNMLYVLTGNGDGTFGAGRTYAPGYHRPHSLVIEDFDGDDVLDVATANDSSTVSIRRGYGTGRFDPGFDIEIAQPPRAFLATDLNNDMRTDLVAAGHDPVGPAPKPIITVLLATSSGDFERLDHDIPDVVGDMAAADLNHDDFPDLVATHFDARTVSVWVGTGDGSFAEPVDIPLSFRPRTLALGDLDGDDNPDLIVTSHDYESYFELHFGTGDGTFSRRQELRFVPNTRYPNTQSIRLGDLDGDGDLDLVAITDTVHVLLNAGDGTFTPHEYRVRASFRDVALVDLDADDDLDIALVGDSHTVLLNAGDGTFACEQNPVAIGGNMAFSDVNRDERVDILTLSNDGLLTVFLQPR